MTKQITDLFRPKYRIEKHYSELFSTDYFEVYQVKWFTDKKKCTTLTHNEAIEFIKYDGTRYQVINESVEVVL